MHITAQATQSRPSSAAMSEPVPVALAAGDGIGPEISAAVCRILEAAGARVSFVPITIGQASYREGVSSGIPAEAWAALREHRVVLKGPITTPQGGGYKSVNVTLRKSARPVRQYPAMPVLASLGGHPPPRHGRADRARE